MDSYKIWLGSFYDASNLYESRRYSACGSLFDDYNIDEDCPLVYRVFENSEEKSDFSLVEVDYLTSAFSDERRLYSFLKMTSVKVDSYYTERVTLTKCCDKLHNIKVIYDQPIIQKAAAQVILSMKNGVSYDDVLLELNNELIDFARKVRSIAAGDSDFIAVAKICGVSSKVINALLECFKSDNTRKEKNSYYSASRKIANCCQSYDDLRALVIAVLEYKKFKMKKVDSVNNLRVKAAFFGDIRRGCVTDAKLAYYFELGGLDNVLNNLTINKIYSFSVADLRKIGFLPDVCMDEELEEYRIYIDRKNSNENSLGEGSMSSNLRYGSGVILDQLVGMKDRNGQINYDEVFATFDMDEVQKVAPWLLQSGTYSFMDQTMDQVLHRTDIDEISTLNYYRSGGELNFEEVFLNFSLDDLFRICDENTLKELGLFVGQTSYVKKYGFRKGTSNDE